MVTGSRCAAHIAVPSAPPDAMYITELQLSVAGLVAYASQVVGGLTITAPTIGNYALTYALLPRLQRYAFAPEAEGQVRPRYGEDLNPLAGSWYCTPARPDQVRTVTSTYRTARDVIAQAVESPLTNRPGFGQMTALAPGTRLTAYVIAAEPFTPAPVIYLGVWTGAVDVDCEVIAVRERRGRFRAATPLNPLDLPDEITVERGDLQLQPPVPLHIGAVCFGSYYLLAEADDSGLPLGLPVGMRYQLDDALLASKRPTTRRGRV